MPSPKPLRVGIVCHYGWDAPVGVQAHIRDLADYLIDPGHTVSVLAQAVEADYLQPY